MLPEYAGKSSKFLAIGLCLQWVSMGMVPAEQPALLALGLIAGLLGVVLCVCGCDLYLRAKGRSRYLRFVGAFGIPGLIVLACLRDRYLAADRGRSAHRQWIKGLLCGAIIGLVLLALPVTLLMLLSKEPPGARPLSWAENLRAIGIIGLFFGLIGGLVGMLATKVVRLPRRNDCPATTSTAGPT